MMGVLFVKPIFVTHKSYQDFVLAQLKRHYSNGILTLVSNDYPVITKLWISDLSCITTFLSKYLFRKRSSRDSASMLRAHLLFLLTNPTIGVTKWVD